MNARMQHSQDRKYTSSMKHTKEWMIAKAKHHIHTQAYTERCREREGRRKMDPGGRERDKQTVVQIHYILTETDQQKVEY